MKPKAKAKGEHAGVCDCACCRYTAASLRGIAAMRRSQEVRKSELLTPAHETAFALVVQGLAELTARAVVVHALTSREPSDELVRESERLAAEYERAVQTAEAWANDPANAAEGRRRRRVRQELSWKAQEVAILQERAEASGRLTDASREVIAEHERSLTEMCRMLEDNPAYSDAAMAEGNRRIDAFAAALAALGVA